MAYFLTRGIVGSKYLRQDDHDKENYEHISVNDNSENNKEVYDDDSNSAHDDTHTTDKDTHTQTNNDVSEGTLLDISMPTQNNENLYADESEDENEEETHEDELKAHENEIMMRTSHVLTWKDKINAASKMAFALRVVDILRDSISLIDSSTQHNGCCNPYGIEIKQQLGNIKHKVKSNNSECIDRVISTYVNYLHGVESYVPDSKLYMFIGGISAMIGLVYNMHLSKYNFEYMFNKKMFLNPITFICAALTVMCVGISFMDISCDHDTAQSKLRMMYIPKILGKKVYTTHLRAKDAIAVIRAISNFIELDERNIQDKENIVKNTEDTTEKVSENVYENEE